MNQVEAFCCYTDVHLQKNGLDHSIIKFDLHNIV